MAKTAQSDVYHKPIKAIGNGWIKLICFIVDQSGDLFQGTGLELHDDGSLTKFSTAQPDWCTVSVAEDFANGDVFGLVKKKGAEILHNQKLASTYSIGTCVYKTAAGTWTVADKDTAASLLSEVGIVCGPADRVTGGVLKGIDDAFTATEPVDICL